MKRIAIIIMIAILVIAGIHGGIALVTKTRKENIMLLQNIERM